MEETAIRAAKQHDLQDLGVIIMCRQLRGCGGFKCGPRHTMRQSAHGDAGRRMWRWLDLRECRFWLSLQPQLSSGLPEMIRQHEVTHCEWHSLWSETLCHDQRFPWADRL
jgi:hypothetical protein